MDGRAIRTARSLVVAGVALFVAAISHLAAGGMLPGSVGLAVAAAFSAVLCVGLGISGPARALSLPRLAASVVASQLVFHTLFAIGAGHATATATATGHHGVTVGFVAGDPLHAMPSSGRMWLAHLLAAAITVTVLRHGERAFWNLCAPVLVVLRMPAAPVPVEPRASRSLTTITVEPDHTRDLGVFLGSMRHRGPPAASSSTAPALSLTPA